MEEIKVEEMETVVEEIANVKTGKGLKIAGGVGIVALAATGVYFLVKKIKTKKNKINEDSSVEDESEETFDEEN